MQSTGRLKLKVVKSYKSAHNQKKSLCARHAITQLAIDAKMLTIVFTNPTELIFLTPLLQHLTYGHLIPNDTFIVTMSSDIIFL